MSVESFYLRGFIVETIEEESDRLKQIETACLKLQYQELSAYIAGRYGYDSGTGKHSLRVERARNCYEFHKHRGLTRQIEVRLGKINFPVPVKIFDLSRSLVDKVRQT